jgi:hypothetical protein
MSASLRSSNNNMQVRILDPWNGSSIGLSDFWGGCSYTVWAQDLGVHSYANSCAGISPEE